MKRAGGSQRSVRVAERIRAELTEMVLRGEIRDPASQGVILSEIHVSPDLRHARIYVRLLDLDPSAARKDAAVAALSKAAGYLRRELGTRLATKFTPELRFFWDDAVDRGYRVEEILREMGNGQSGNSGKP